MQSLKILIAALTLIFASTVLDGCTPAHGNSEIGVQRIEQAQEMKKTARLELLPAPAVGNISLRLVIENPERKPITSVESWLSYNPDLLSGVLIDADKSPFQIVAPYDNTFDQESGLVMIGRSSATPVDDEEILVAEIQFQKLGEGAAMIESYDYRNDLSGHSSVNIVVDKTPYNILIKPESPLFSTQ